MSNCCLLLYRPSCWMASIIWHVLGWQVITMQMPP
jgi:hypothetical protein